MQDGGQIGLVRSKQYSGLTFKYLREALGKVISNKEQLEKLMSHIQCHREVKEIVEIKRL